MWHFPNLFDYGSFILLIFKLFCSILGDWCSLKYTLENAALHHESIFSTL